MKGSWKGLNWRQAIALLSGGLMSAAVMPIGVWWIAWIAIVPLWIWSVERKSRGSLPLLWGIGYHGVTLWWLTGLHPLMWMGIPWAASVSIVAVAWTFITLWGAACVVLWSRSLRLLARWKVAPLLRVLCGTALWCALETVRQWTPLDWTSLALTQSPNNLAILHWGQISGPLVITAAIVAVNGLIAEAWLQRSENAKTSRLLFTSTLVLFLSLHLAGFFILNRPLSESSNINVGLVQGNVPTREKLFKDGLKKALDGYSSGYRDLVSQNVDVVLTPEGSLPFLWEGINKTGNPVYQAVREKRVPMWLGTFQREGTHYTQSLLTIAPDGETVGRFNKVKLVPLGEYIPFEETIGKVIGRLSPISSSMLPGHTNQQFESLFGRAAVGICYESAFPNLFRSQVAAGAKFLITASNLDPYNTVLMAQHEAQDVMRAIETDRWMVRATNTGYSGIVNPHGQVQWRSQPYQYEIHAGTIHPRTTQTLYVKWGDWVTPSLIGASVVLLGIRRRG